MPSPLVLYVRLGCDSSEGRPKYIDFVDVRPSAATRFFRALLESGLNILVDLGFLLTYSVVSLVSSSTLLGLLGCWGLSSMVSQGRSGMVECSRSWGTSDVDVASV